MDSAVSGCISHVPIDSTAVLDWTRTLSQANSCNFLSADLAGNAALCAARAACHAGWRFGLLFPGDVLLTAADAARPALGAGGWRGDWADVPNERVSWGVDGRDRPALHPVGYAAPAGI